MQLDLASREPSIAIVEFEQILASNSGEDPFDSAIKLLASKLVDEIERQTGATPNFAIQKTPEATHRAVQALYRKALQKWPHINGAGSNLDISPQHLVRSMRPLIGWQLLDSDQTWLDATLERLVAKDSKGALGQYFTPRDIVKFCVEILNPGSKDKVIDPACGSGGFLFEATKHALRNSGAAPTCLGIDFGARAIKVAALLSAATLKARITVSKANSIDGRNYELQSPPEWEPFLSRQKGAQTKRADTWGNWNRLGCNVLLTNPPFAGDIDEYEVLSAYESQQNVSRRHAISREHLFLERAVQLLRPGGRMAIVVPQGLLANSSASYIRSWLIQRCRVLGVIGLHQNAFLPYTGVKTALLFVTKLADGELPPKRYPIFFASSIDSGKDSRGRLTGTSDYALLKEAFSNFLFSQKLPWTGSSVRSKQGGKYSEVPIEEAIKAGRLDAEYFDAVSRALVQRLDTNVLSQITKHVEPKLERFKKSLFKEIRYLDISSVDSKTGLTDATKILASDAPSRASYMVQPGDVLVSTVRPDRNVVALVTENPGLPTVASNGFCVLRPKSISSEVLFAYCKTDAFKRMLSRHATASMYPTVTDKDVLGIVFPAPPAEVAKRVTELIRSGLQMVEKAQKQLAEAISIMDSHVESPPSFSESDIPQGPKIEQVSRTYSTKKRKR